MTAAMLLQQKIREVIPLSESMQFSIEKLNLDQIRVSAPLEPNINIHGTGFAGSIYSVAVLTGWALCTHIMSELEIGGELVVARAEISYRAPVTSDLKCRCDVNAELREAFMQGVQNHGKGKMLLEIEVGKRQAVLQGTFIAITR